MVVVVGSCWVVEEGYVWADEQNTYVSYDLHEDVAPSRIS